MILAILLRWSRSKAQCQLRKDEPSWVRNGNVETSLGPINRLEEP